MYRYVECIDAGSDYCPCTLAERGECIICSQLRGKDFCDCLYFSGTCILQEYIWNNKKSKDIREFKEYEILEKKYLREDIFLIDVKVTKEMARELNRIGAFVFLKKKDDMLAYSLPATVLKSFPQDGIIEVGIKVKGVKTKALNECTDRIMIKGPYYNGIQGIKYIKKLINSKVMIIVRGSAGFSTVMAAKKLINAGNEVFVFLDPGRCSKSYIEDFFVELGCSIYSMPLTEKDILSKGAMAKILEVIGSENIKNILIGGSNEFIGKVMRFIYLYNNSIDFSITNNSIMCCGEGICGSCQITTPSGNIIRSCKQQYNPAEVFLKGMDDL